VAGVQFSVDASPLGAEDTTAPYSAVWDTTTASNGTHALRAVARDTAGQTSSASVTVTVDNPPPPPPLAFLVGDQAIEPAVDSNAAGTAEAFLRRAAATGTVTQLNVYVDASSTASTVAVGFYSGGGHPTRLLTQGTIAAPVAGAWNSVTVPAAAVSANTKYWIALLGPRGAGTIRFRDRCCGGGSATETSAQTTLTSLPATWSTGRLFSDGPISAYGAGR
jgi:hypothetical protein